MILHHCLLPYKAIGSTSVGNGLHSGFTHLKPMIAMNQSIVDLSRR